MRLLTVEVLPWGKQIKLQVEIVKGVKVKKTLVEVAKSYDASKLVVGTSDKHFSVGSVGSFLVFPHCVWVSVFNHFGEIPMQTFEVNLT